MKLSRCFLLCACIAGSCTSDSAPETRVLGPVPELGVRRTTAPPRIDGRLGDRVWQQANGTGRFVETRFGGESALQASAKLLWDRDHLYVAVDVRDPLLVASHTERDSHLWEQDCVELMIDPDGDAKSYFEIQLSPRGVVFDTRFDQRRRPPPYGRVDWDARMRAAVDVRGTLDDEASDAGYSVELAIPWHAFSLRGAAVGAPQIGDRWRFNVYAIDLGRGQQRAAAWSPLGMGDFHVPSRFGILRFEGEAEPIKPRIAPSHSPKPDVEHRQRLESSGAGH